MLCVFYFGFSVWSLQQQTTVTMTSSATQQREEGRQRGRKRSSTHTQMVVTEARLQNAAAPSTCCSHTFGKGNMFQTQTMLQTLEWLITVTKTMQTCIFGQVQQLLTDKENKRKKQQPQKPESVKEDRAGRHRGRRAAKGGIKFI